MKKRYNTDAGDRARGEDGGPVLPDPVHLVSIDDIRPSPFQPAGRPSASALAQVRAAIADAGSIDELMGKSSAPEYERLSEEARELVSLAWDVRNHGIQTPLEARRDADGALELLSGHRRLAAARLAGLMRVPLMDHGAMSDAQAKAQLLRANLHRAGFKILQQARLLRSLEVTRADAGSQDTIRTLAQAAGMSHGHVGSLLQIADAISPEIVAAVGGDDVLASASFRTLHRIARETDAERRIELARREVGPRAPRATVDRQPFQWGPRRGGGFELRCDVPISAMSFDDANRLRLLLEDHLAQIAAHLKAKERDAA